MGTRRIAALIALGCLALSLGAASGARAASLQSIGGFVEPMYVTSPPREPNRLFVVERVGRIKQVENGKPSEFADLREAVDCCYEDRGLQSMAVAPDFATSGRFYVDYTDSAGDIHIAEMRAQGRTAPFSTLRNLLTIPFEPNANHYGGQLQFGPDGYLYISTGDGGYGERNDEHHNAQSLGTLLGKLLRIDPNPSGVLPYTVPPGNPFASAPAPYDTIWSYGLRNPYRFSFDPPSGQIAIPDVGEEQREEVDLLPVSASAGADFGWNCMEGRLPGPATDPECATPPAAGYVSPVFEYGHKQTSGAYGCAIIGGYIVRDPSLGDLYGRYVYTDFCTAQVRSFNPSDPAGTDRSENLQLGEPTSFGEDSCGRLYLMGRGGSVDRLVGAQPAKCVTHLKSKLAIRARGRVVKRGAKTLIVARVTPCKNRKKGSVVLYLGNKRVAAARLSGKCVARFHPRVTRRGAYRAKVVADDVYAAASSPRLTLRVTP